MANIEDAAGPDAAWMHYRRPGAMMAGLIGETKTPATLVATDPGDALGAGPDPTSAAAASDSTPRPRVYILARKILLRNTRIFKQANSLTAAGYSVTVIGIQPVGGDPRERRDGYLILRVRLDPLHARIPRRIRQIVRTARGAITRQPSRYARVAAHVRRRLRGVRFLIRAHVLAACRRFPPAQWLAAAWNWAIDTSGAPHRTDRVRASSMLLRALALPFVLGARLLQRLGLTLNFASGLLCQLGRAVDRAIKGSLRRFVRMADSVLRSFSDFMVARTTALLRPFVMPLRSFEFYRQVHRLVTAELAPPDVIHANDLDTLLIAYVLARRYKVPLVYDAQELYVGVHTLSGWYRRVLSLQERLLVKHADRITVVNDAIKDVMEHKYRIAVDAVVLNCPPLVEATPSRSIPTLHERFGLPHDQAVLLYSGALTPHRGLPNLIRALVDLDGVQLVLLGEGFLREELERLSARIGVKERVVFADFIHHADVPGFISSADVGVIPYEPVGVNHYLCSPSKLFHYIMARLPIVCSDFPFLRHIVVQNAIGDVCNPQDPKSIAAAVRRLIDSPGAREACRERMGELRHTYCWEEQEKQFMSLYRSLPVRTPAGRTRPTVPRRRGAIDAWDIHDSYL